MEDSKIITEAAMQTETIFREDGSIHTYPSSHELGRCVATGKLSQRGRCITDENGETHFTPYNEGGVKTSENLHCTAHGIATKTKRSIKIAFKFPNTMSNVQMSNAIIDECRDMAFKFIIKK